MEKDFRFLIYKSEEEDISVDAVVKDESIWLTQKGMAELFGVQVPAINKHLKNISKQLDIIINILLSTNNLSSAELEDIADIRGGIYND